MHARNGATALLLLSKPRMFRVTGTLEALVALKNKLYLERSVMKQGIMGHKNCACFLLRLSPVSLIMKFYFELLRDVNLSYPRAHDVLIVCSSKRDMYRLMHSVSLVKNIACLCDVHISDKL